MEYTGELYFGDIFFLGGSKDVLLSYKATFIKGMLDSIGVSECSFQDNTDRKRSVNLIIKKISRREKISKNFFYRFLYLPYKFVIDFALRAIRSIVFVVFKSLDYLLIQIHKLLAPI